jgi:hypothetical protein
MQDNIETRGTFSMTMYGVAEDFGGTLSESNLFVRFEALKKYSIDQITQAGTWLLKNRKEKFPAVPKTQEFIEAIRVMQGEIVGPKAIARNQCDIVMKYFNGNWTPYNGYIHTFKDSITDYLMRTQWSFQKLGAMGLDDLKWFPKNFIEAYLDYASEGEAAQTLICSLEDKDKVSAKRLGLLVQTKGME